MATTGEVDSSPKEVDANCRRDKRDLFSLAVLIGVLCEFYVQKDCQKIANVSPAVAFAVRPSDETAD